MPSDQRAAPGGNAAALLHVLISQKMMSEPDLLIYSLEVALNCESY